MIITSIEVTNLQKTKAVASEAYSAANMRNSQLRLKARIIEEENNLTNLSSELYEKQKLDAYCIRNWKWYNLKSVKFNLSDLDTARGKGNIHLSNNSL